MDVCQPPLSATTHSHIIYPVCPTATSNSNSGILLPTTNREQNAYRRTWDVSMMQAAAETMQHYCGLLAVCRRASGHPPAAT
jgi:hypothetical protein